LSFEFHRNGILDSNACIRYPMSPIGTSFQIAWGDHIQSKLPSRWDSKCRDFTSSSAASGTDFSRCVNSFRQNGESGENRGYCFCEKDGRGN